MSLSSNNRLLKISFLILILIASLLLVSHALIASIEGQYLFSDDAYYYIIIARNFATKGFISFDTINETNGFHPLWFIILVIVYLFIGDTLSMESQGLIISFIEQMIWLIMILGIIYYSYRHLDNKRYYFGLTLLCWLIYPLNHTYFTLGMETTIASLIFLYSLYLYHEKKEFLFSISLALLVLARLEMYFFFIVPFVLMVVFSKTGISNLVQMIKDSFRLLLPSSLVLGGIAIVNYIQFNNFFPISGALKSGFPFEINFQPTLFLDMFLRAVYTRSFTLFLYIMPLYILIGFVIVFIYSLVTLRKRVFSSMVFIYSAVGLLLMSNILLFQKWSKVIETWYMTIPMLLLGLIISTLVMRNITSINNLLVRLLSLTRITRLSTPTNVRRIKALVIVGFVTFSMGYSLIQIHEHTTAVSSSDPFVEWINSIDDNVILAATDCGRRAFFYDKIFVNLDGLVNSYEYQEVLRNGSLYDYLKRINVTYIVVGIRDGDYPYILRDYDKIYAPMISPAVLYGDYTYFNFTIYSYEYGVYSDPIALNKTSEVFRGPLGGDEVKVRTIVYRL